MDSSKYGSVYIYGKSMNIEKLSVEELNDYIQIKEKQRIQLIEQQNDYLSQIIN